MYVTCVYWDEVSIFQDLRHNTQTAEVENSFKLGRVRQYLRALGRLYWELGRVVLHRCCSPCWSVLVLELRAMSPTVVRAALLGEIGGTSSMTISMGLFQMDPKGGAGEAGPKMDELVFVTL